MAMSLKDAKNALNQFIIGRRWFVSRDSQDAARVILQELINTQNKLTSLDNQIKTLETESVKNTINKTNLNTAIQSVKDITVKYNKLLGSNKVLENEVTASREQNERNAEYADKLHEQLEDALAEAKNSKATQAELAKLRQERDEEYAAHSKTIEDAAQSVGQEQVYVSNLQRELDNVTADYTILKNSRNLEMENLRKEVIRLRESEEKAKRLQEELERERSERLNLVEKERELQERLEESVKELAEVSAQAVTAQGKANEVDADIEVAINHLQNLLSKPKRVETFNLI